MIKLKGTVSKGALRPCHQCSVDAIRDMSSIGQKSKTYYIPLTVPGKMEHCLEDILSNLCMHDKFERTYHQLDIARNEAERKQIQRETGIDHVSLLSLLPYFDMARSVPHRFMHMVYINQFKALIKLWHGEFKGLDSGTGHYVITGLIWKTIGIETRWAIKTIPASFICSIPNIETNFNSFTAKDNAFWLIYLALYLLAGCLPEPYYLHMLNLIKIIKVCIGFGMTRAELNTLSTDLYEWHLGYEDHYFQHNLKCLSIMMLAGHGMDHLPDNINNTGLHQHCGSL